MQMLWAVPKICSMTSFLRASAPIPISFHHEEEHHRTEVALAVSQMRSIAMERRSASTGRCFHLLPHLRCTSVHTECSTAFAN